MKILFAERDFSRERSHEEYLSEGSLAEYCTWFKISTASLRGLLRVS